VATRKVAYLTPLYFDEKSCLGGGERYPLNLARGVVGASKGTYHVELLSFGASTHRQQLSEGVTLRVMASAGRPTNALDVVSWELPEALATADLVHIHQAYNRCAELGVLVAKQQRKPVCITDHGGYSSSLGTELEFLELVDCVVPYSDFGARQYRTRTPIVTIKGGVDGSLFTPPSNRPVRDRVTYVGRLLPHKGIDRLIQALPVDVPLTVCGRPYHENYFRLLRSLAASKRVEFITDADDTVIRDLYARAWANVLPSVYEDCYGNIYQLPELMGFTLLEAMACGTPAIASRVGAMPEFIEHGQTGFVFNDLAELSDQLLLLSRDPARVEAMGQNARMAVEREFDLKISGARLHALYEDLITHAQEVAA
jgi:glycosyltransferase involved in cell wall biosynthesis